jgi:putative FmdB family regulatory protein
MKLSPGEFVMPTYEYECKSCGHTFDVFQSMKDDPLKDCPQCGRELRRIINGGTGVIFKGSGFYVTDKNKGAAAKPGAKTPAGEPENTAADKAAGKAADTTDKSGGNGAGKPSAPETPGKAAPAAPSAPAASAEKKAAGQ